ncbi:sarcosine oxidase subunit beta [Halomicrobium zhouii]|uniref:Sarcosine oxidase subunit beta n=1 Tax=Halomicrobium zhouii TaxID=767519 RepID=A0A1I6LEW8_9EURY|nr:FAD-binding oxidoreductase [Halomicrobium zhouii]SFS01987.1 sarcosine oxidase subunit beta [Halomicrobium zhouii]
MTRVAVVGGGAVGLAAARHLADAGADVVLYERGGIASGSTGRAAGICYDAFAEDLDAAIGAESLRRFRELGVLTECPYVWLAREGDDANADAIREQVPRMQAHGRNVELVDPEALADRYPQLRTDDVAVAAIAHEAGHVDPGAYAALVADELDSAAAVDVRTDAPVALDDPTTVDSPTGAESFDAVLVAAGPETKPIVADVGVSLALKAYRAQALVTESLHATLPMTYDATQHVYWRPRDGGLFVGDGAHPVDPGDWDRQADDSFLESALERLRAATTLAPRVDRSWAGLCTATPDRDPLLGEVADGLFVASGWHGHGFMRSPAMGERVAAQMLGDGDGSVAHYDPDRFDGDEEFAVVEGMTLDED